MAISNAFRSKPKKALLGWFNAPVESVPRNATSRQFLIRNFGQFPILGHFLLDRRDAAL